MLKNYLLPCTYCVILIPFLLFLAALFLPHPHTSFILHVYLFHLYFFPPSSYSDAFSLSPPVLPVLPFFLQMNHLSVFSVFVTHPCIPNTHKHWVLCHSDFLHLQFLPSRLASPCPSSQEQYKCKAFSSTIIYGAAVAIIFMLLISALSTVHNLDRNILS